MMSFGFKYTSRIHLSAFENAVANANDAYSNAHGKKY